MKTFVFSISLGVLMDFLFKIRALCIFVVCRKNSAIRIIDYLCENTTSGETRARPPEGFPWKFNHCWQSHESCIVSDKYSMIRKNQEKKNHRKNYNKMINVEKRSQKIMHSKQIHRMCGVPLVRSRNSLNEYRQYFFHIRLPICA